MTMVVANVQGEAGVCMWEICGKYKRWCFFLSLERVHFLCIVLARVEVTSHDRRRTGL